MEKNTPENIPAQVRTRPLPLPAEGFVRVRSIITEKGRVGVLPLGRTRWYSGVKSGEFPRGVLIAPRVRAWPVEQIRELLARMGEQAATADTKN